ncbi:hypothetical protein AB0I72_26885 [Nocardiopsis sp. NPDC049922]|uniref:hypothetical protein n=1 Tax=Nocardiopsis sp. NPDC049922 TaxID=3155157 RepID=UPI0033F5C75C
MARIRVVHVPARTPYARKLSSEHVGIVNSADGVPRDLTLRQVLGRRPLTWFDVLHLHHIEFDDLSTLRLVLSECARARRRVVFTAHDLEPIFTPRSQYRRKLRLLAEWRVPFVCLTPGSEAEVRRRWRPETTVLAPHGYVAPPQRFPGRDRQCTPEARYLLFGALRDNRDVTTVLYNWRFGRRQQETSLTLLLRSPGSINIEQERDRWELIATMATAEPRLRVELAPFPTDAEVVSTAQGCDALILPYVWGTHSGQLELAFDLGLLPITSDVGFLREQYQQHDGLVPEPVWFDWSDGAEYAYGERFGRALEQAVGLMEKNAPVRDADAFAQHRREEHQRVMSIHHELYESAWS